MVDAVRAQLAMSASWDVAGALDLAGAGRTVLPNWTSSSPAIPDRCTWRQRWARRLWRCSGPPTRRRYGTRAGAADHPRRPARCSPCGQVRLPPERGAAHVPDCMDGIQVDRVVAAALELPRQDAARPVRHWRLIDVRHGHLWGPKAAASRRGSVVRAVPPLAEQARTDANHGLPRACGSRRTTTCRCANVSRIAAIRSGGLRSCTSTRCGAWDTAISTILARVDQGRPRSGAVGGDDRSGRFAPPRWRSRTPRARRWKSAVTMPRGADWAGQASPLVSTRGCRDCDRRAPSSIASPVVARSCTRRSGGRRAANPTGSAQESYVGAVPNAVARSGSRTRSVLASALDPPKFRAPMVDPVTRASSGFAADHPIERLAPSRSLKDSYRL